MFKSWFTNIPKNAQSPQLAQINQTFMKGGFYRFDIDQKISVLGLNTLYYGEANDRSQQGTTPDDQIDWLEQQLGSIKDEHKYILIMHYYPGVQYQDGVREDMLEVYTIRFRDILMAHYHKIIIILGGHEHLADLRYHSNDFTQKIQFEFWERNLYDKYFYYNFIENPSVSPNKGNNPGYSILEVDDDTLEAENQILRYFQLSNTYDSGYSFDGSFIFYQIDLKNDYGFKDLTPESFSEFKNRLLTDSPFLFQFLSNKFGFFQEDQKKCIKNLYQDYLDLITDEMKTYKYICLMHKSIYKNELKNCIYSNK